MGLNLWLVCLLESLQMRHTASLWSRQKSLSFSECREQRTSDPVELLCSLSWRAASHRFFKARLRGGLLFGDLVLQHGHSNTLLPFHQLLRQTLQKLWLHNRTTGSLKMSWQTGQDKFSSDTENIFCPERTENKRWVQKAERELTFTLGGGSSLQHVEIPASWITHKFLQYPGVSLPAAALWTNFLIFNTQ